MSFSLPPTTASPDAGVASQVLDQLRAECDGATTDAPCGILLHEIGVLEDTTQNEGQAARDLLSAVNVLPEFHEPLERLVALIERRKSYKNLGKLIDRLVKIAGTPEELTRALVALAEFREDQEGDVTAAREALERAAQARSDDVDAWLYLERVAVRLGDETLRRRALAARAILASDPAWRALLSIDVAKLHAAAGDTDAAVASLERALEAKTTSSFAALTELLDIPAKAGRHELAARAFEGRAALIDRPLAGVVGGGKPLEAAATHLGSEPLAAELFLLGADTAARSAGDPNAAKAALSQAAAAGASLEVVARTGRMLAALASDTAWFDEATRRLLATSPPESERPALWFELGRSRLLRGDVGGAAEAFSGLSSVPGGAWLGSVLRAYALPRKDSESKGALGAKALESLSELLPDAELARALRMAAAIRFRLSGETDEAVAGLRGLHGEASTDLITATALSTLLRLGRESLDAADVLAECAKGLGDSTVAATLHLEAGIVRWLGGDRARALEAFDAAARLAPEAGSGLFAWALRAAQPNSVDARRRALDAAPAREDPA